jgi:hypothetical protein
VIWLDSIYDLQYYHPVPGIPCYCQTLVYPSDLTLQGIFPPGNRDYTFVVKVYSADGLTEYETATSYFNYFLAVNPITGQHFFSARLNGYSPAMCTHACWILRVTVFQGAIQLFDKYTERYCQFSCCDVVRSVNIAQESMIGTAGTGTVTTSAANPKTSPCGDVYITLRSKYDCYDKFTGEYYGIPNDVISGTAFEFEVVNNFKGRIVRRPREITREYSFNCRLQRVEAAPTFYLEGFDFFPPWKMYEIEGQLTSTEIYVDDTRYEFNGGAAFETIHDCLELFKLSVTLNGCIVRQVFGCDTTCAPALNYDGANMMYIIPSDYQVGSDSPFVPTDYFYSETGVLVAYTYEDLLNYIRSLDGVTAVTDIDISGIECEPYAAFSVTGTGYVPTSFYYGSVTQSNRVFGVVLGSIDEICDTIPVTCDAPALGIITVSEDNCDAPVLGTITVTDMSLVAVPINGFGDWVEDVPPTGATIYGYQVTFSLTVFNPNYPDIDSPPQPPIFNGEIIGVIGAEGRPITNIALDENNSNVPAGTNVIITPTGTILFAGEPTTSDGTGSTIVLTNIIYNTIVNYP